MKIPMVQAAMLSIHLSRLQQAILTKQVIHAKSPHLLGWLASSHESSETLRIGSGVTGFLVIVAVADFSSLESCFIDFAVSMSVFKTFAGGSSEWGRGLEICWLDRNWSIFLSAVLPIEKKQELRLTHWALYRFARTPSLPPCYPVAADT